MSTKILALSIECQSWLIVTWFVRIIIYCAPKEFIWFNCNYNQMVCFLKYWKGLNSCWILNSTQWSRDSRYCIPVFVNSENWIQDYLFLFPFYSNER